MLDDYKIEWNRLNFDQNETHNLSPLLNSLNPTGLLMRPIRKLVGPKATIETINIMTTLDMANRADLLHAALSHEINLPYGLIGKGSDKQTKGVWFIAVGDRIDKEQKESIKSHVFSFAHNPGLFIRTWYFVAKIPNSPLELHYRWHPETESQMAILGYENDWTPKDNKKIIELIGLKGTKMGRPKGSGYPSTVKRDLLDEAYQARREGANWNSAEIQRIVNLSKNGLIDWRKSFLEKIVPIINQMRQEGFSKTEIAKALNTTPELLEMYIEDAKVLGIN